VGPATPHRRGGTYVPRAGPRFCQVRQTPPNLRLEMLAHCGAAPLACRVGPMARPLATPGGRGQRRLARPGANVARRARRRKRGRRGALCKRVCKRADGATERARFTRFPIGSPVVPKLNVGSLMPRHPRCLLPATHDATGAFRCHVDLRAALAMLKTTVANWALETLTPICPHKSVSVHGPWLSLVGSARNSAEKRAKTNTGDSTETESPFEAERELR
jgi:hypothetical protein